MKIKKFKRKWKNYKYKNIQPYTHIGEICIEESPKVQAEVQEINECESPQLIVVMEKECETPIEGLELPIVKVEHIDFIGVDHFEGLHFLFRLLYPTSIFFATFYLRKISFLMAISLRY